MSDISIPDGAAERLRGYGYKPNGTQVDTKQLARMITRLPGVANDPMTFAGIQYILERYINGNDDAELRESVQPARGNDDNRKAGKGRSGKGRRSVSDVLPSL